MVNYSIERSALFNLFYEDMKIYTRKGDQGQTQLIGGTLVNKDDSRLECYGTIDELNSLLGLCVASLRLKELETTTNLKDLEITNEMIKISELKTDLLNIQNYLFNIGSHMACENELVRKKIPPLKEEELVKLENKIDKMTEELPPLKEFILPGGHPSAALLQLARSLCRRAERQVSATYKENKTILSYLNRLSDYLFVGARYINHQLSISEQIWKKE